MKWWTDDKISWKLAEHVELSTRGHLAKRPECCSKEWSESSLILGFRVRQAELGRRGGEPTGRQ